MGHDTFRTSREIADSRMRVVKARVELCPLEPALSASVVVSPCAGFELGSHSGQSYEDGTRVTDAYAESRVWAAAAASARARFRRGQLRVSVGPELVVPITRNRFALRRPERSLYEVPSVAFAASAVVGVAW
jgi:hypothetical protein